MGVSTPSSSVVEIHLYHHHDGGKEVRLMMSSLYKDTLNGPSCPVGSFLNTNVSLYNPDLS